jgi:hypothetical protein
MWLSHNPISDMATFKTLIYVSNFFINSPVNISKSWARFLFETLKQRKTSSHTKNGAPITAELSHIHKSGKQIFCMYFEISKVSLEMCPIMNTLLSMLIRSKRFQRIEDIA